MAVSKNLFIDLTTDPLTDWQKHGGGDQTLAVLEPDCSFTLHEDLSTDGCWMIEAVLSVGAAPLDPDGARLWAYFHKHDPSTYTLDTYAVQVRLVDDAGTRKLELRDVADAGNPVATLVLDQGWDWTDAAPRIRVRLRLDVDGDATARTLHLEAEPSDDPLFDKSSSTLKTSTNVDDLATLDGSLLELGFGNFGAQSSVWDSVHVALADRGTALPYWPAPVTPDTDHDSPVDNVPGFRVFSLDIGETTVEFDCQPDPETNYLDGDDLTLSLDVSQGEAPDDRDYGSVPAGLDSHTFTGLDDEQDVTAKVSVCDVSGRCTQEQAVIHVDHTEAVLSIDSVTPEYAKAGTLVTVQFTANEPLKAGTIHVTIGGEDMQQGAGTDPYVFTYTATGTETPGPQTVVVQAEDTAGNASEVTDVGSVTLDFVDPSIDAPGASVDEPFVADGQTFNLYVDVTDVGTDVDSADVTVTLDGRPLDFVEQVGSTFQFEYTVDSALDSSGPQSVDVHALDLAGNDTSATLTDVIIFDFDPPAVTVETTPDTPVGDNKPFSITLNVTDDYASVDDASFTVTVGGQTMAEGTFADPSFEFTGTASSAVSTEGTQDIVVTVRDEAGNQAEQTFPDALTFDFTPPVVLLEESPSAPVGDGMMHVTLDINDALSDIDTGANFQVTLGGRAMTPGGFSHPSYPFSLTVNSGDDSEGTQDLVVTVRDTAGNEVVETFPAAVSYDFVGPVVSVDDSPTAPVTHGDTVDIVLNVTDDYSQIDIGSSFVVTLGGRTMVSGTFAHPSYPFSILVDSTEDTPGPQDLAVTVYDAAGNKTEQTFDDVLTYDFGGPEVVVDISPTAPVASGNTVNIELLINDDLSDIDTGSGFVVTLGSREMARSTFAHPRYAFTLEVNDALDSAGPQELRVTVSNTAGVETVAPFADEVTFDFEGPEVTLVTGPADPQTHNDTVEIELSISDDYSAIDTGSGFAVTLGGRAMTRGTFAHPSYRFSIQVNSAEDTSGDQDLVVTVSDGAGNETEQTFPDAVTYDFSGPEVVVDISPSDPAKNGDRVDIELLITDEQSNIDAGAGFVVTLGGRIMTSGTFAHPRYPFHLDVDDMLDSPGGQELRVTVSNTAGVETVAPFPDEVTFDFAGPEISVGGSPATPVSHGATVSFDLTITDDYSAIDTGPSFTVTLGGRDMTRGTFAHPSYPFSIDVDETQDSPGLQNLVVTVSDATGNETEETALGLVTYDFEGPVVAVHTSPSGPLVPGETVNITLDISDEYSEINTDSSFVVTLGDREMARGTFAHPHYPFTLEVDSALDAPGPQDLLVTVYDAAGNKTEQPFTGLVTYDFSVPLALDADKMTLVCAKGDDGLFHQQYDSELQVSTLPTDDTPYVWVLNEITEWNDIATGENIVVTIDPYADSVWTALPDGDPRKDAIRLSAIVPVAIDVPDAVWPEEHDPATPINPWFRFTGTVDGDAFSVTVYLRTLTADAFLVFEKQDRAGLVQLSQAPEPGTALTWSVEASTGMDSGFTVGFDHDPGDTDHVGARISVDHSAGDWPYLGTGGELLDPDDLGSGSFDLKLSAPGYADSYIPCGVRLRKLLGDRHLAFFGQIFEDDHPDVLWKESAALAATGEGFHGSVVDIDGVELSTQPLVLNDLLGLAEMPSTAPASGFGSPAWNEDQSFNLRIQSAADSVVPASFFNGRGLHFRELTPETLVFAEKLSDDFQSLVPGVHEELISVAGTSETWVFGDVDEFDLDSDLNLNEASWNVVTAALGITWEGDDLKPRETGDLAVVLLRADDSEIPLSPPVRVSIPVEVTRETGVKVLHTASGTASDRLPDACHDLRYKGELEALVFDLQDEDKLEWTLVDAEVNAVPGVDNPLDLEKIGELEYDADDILKQAQLNAVQTADTPVAMVIPTALTAKPDPYTLQVSVTHLKPLAAGGYKEVAGAALYDLKLHVHETPANFDVAILLDRSGSMGGNRWKAACDGADLFATLLKETGVDSRVGVYWFWGDDSSSPTNYPNDDTYDGNQGYHGTFPAADGTLPADQLTIATNRALTVTDLVTEEGEVYDICHPDGPDHYTALGAGLLHCRDELVKHSNDTDTDGNKRGRMILVLSDGMENREPKLAPVFFDAPDDHWNLYTDPDASDATVHPGGPSVRIHSVAMLTSDAWANKLRDVAAETGGLWALDVQHIRPNKVTDALALTENWFLTSFAGLFDFDESAVMVDPALEPEQEATQKLLVNLAMDTLVFYHLSGAADLGKWTFTVKLPDTDVKLTPTLAEAHEGISYHRGKMYQMYVVRFPLGIPGHEHRWVGEWLTQLIRNADTGTGHYGLGALSRQDRECRVDVLTRPRPRPGDEATVRVQLRDRRGNRIRKARVSTTVYTPGPWAGDAVARRVATDLALVKKLRKSASKANRDMQDVSDRVLRHMLEKGELKAGRTYKRRLKEVAPGLYETRIKLPEAGHYQLDTTVRGEQRFSSSALSDHLRPHLRRLRRDLPLPLLTKELKYLNKRFTTRQPFSLAAARHVGVLFDPSVKHSPSEGWFVDDKCIRLDVAPTDRKGRLLGPGWAEELTFNGPAGISQRWPAIDCGDGHYKVDVPFRAKNLRFEMWTATLAADRLELGHPSGLLRPLHDRLPLDGFSADVLGVRIPITIQALVGNRATCEVHLITCPHARKIKPKNRVFFHDLEAASDAGFDTCELCLPLICNMDPEHLEAHKPFCTWARRISQHNELEVHSIKAALALGFDGCYYCLPEYHDE